jgi:hypothetical protein
MVSISSLIFCLQVRTGAYPREEQLKGASLELALALEIYSWAGKACQGKHSGLFGLFESNNKKVL